MFKNIYYILFIFLFTNCDQEKVKDKNPTNNVLKSEIKSNLNLSEIEEEILKNPNSTNPYYKRAIYYKSLKKYVLALEDINRALNLSPEASMLNYEKAVILFEYGLNRSDQSLIDNAKIYLDEAMILDKDNYLAYLLKAEILIDLRDSLESMKLVQYVIKNDETNSRAYYLKGLIYDLLYFRNNLEGFIETKTNRDMERAISSYQTAIELDPQLYDPYIYIGMLLEMKKDDKAIMYLEQALELEPYSFEAYRNLGLYYHFTSRYNEARIYFNKILEIDSSFVEAYFNIGNSYIGLYSDNMNQYSKDTTLERASYYFQRSIEMYPEYVQAIHNLGVVYEFQGNFKKAKEFYLKAIEIDNNYMPSLEAINSL